MVRWRRSRKNETGHVIEPMNEWMQLYMYFNTLPAQLGIVLCHQLAIFEACAWPLHWTVAAAATHVYIYIYTYTSRKDAQRAATAAVRTMASDYTCRYAHPHLWPSNFFRFITRITSPIQWINECNECNAMSKRKPQCKWPHNSILHIARAIRPCLCMFSFTKLQIVVVSVVRRTKFETFCICTQQVEKKKHRGLYWE